MLAFHELIPRFKKLKRRASLEFCIHLDMSQIGIICFTKQCLGIFILHHFKAFFASLFGLSLAERSKIAITFLVFGILKIPGTPFCRTDDSDLTHLNKRKSANSKLARRFSFLNQGVSSRKATMEFLFSPN